jgi:hypothetical protein
VTEQQYNPTVTPTEPPKKSNTGLIILIVVLVILFCCCLSVVVLYYTGDAILDYMNDILIQYGLANTGFVS